MAEQLFKIELPETGDGEIQLIIFPETINTDYRPTLTTVVNEGDEVSIIVELEERSVGDIERAGGVSITRTVYEALLVHYSANCEASRLGKTPVHAPKPPQQ